MGISSFCNDGGDNKNHSAASNNLCERTAVRNTVVFFSFDSASGCLSISSIVCLYVLPIGIVAGVSVFIWIMPEDLS